MKENRCGCHRSGVIYPVNLKRKALIKKIFLLECSCTVRVKISGKLKLEAKILQRVHFDYLLVFYLRNHFKMYVICLNRTE